MVAMDTYPPDWFGFDSLKDFLGSRAQHVKGTVYDLIGALGTDHFDFVIFLGVLYHLRHRCSRSTTCGRCWRRTARL